VVIEICKKLIHDEKSCERLFDIYGKGVIDAVTSSHLSPEYFCEELAPACVDSGFLSVSPTDGALKLVENKPFNLHNNDYLTKLYKAIRENLKDPKKPRRNTVTAVHFSDAHIDKGYTIGTFNTCEGPQSCCRIEFGLAKEPEKKAL
jgi:hypothetical protein